MDPTLRCPCLSGLTYGECCGRAHAGTPAATAEALMRSRFSAFAVGDVDYLLHTWHPHTRPGALELDPDLRWYRLDIEGTSAGGPLDRVGTVEFTAYYRSPDGKGTQHERSHFTRENGRWYYRDADPTIG
ncbi:hypothetical protein D9V34_10530 [Mycetocola lacteus]|uniref:UPF0225 protein D9V34_10530 n=1 Tax=Mycetocola lacteus TaxID=76637 RepID=A0A3L7AS24_9MICO|nr:MULTISPECIES: YchJ family protein [Mycetocola]MCS4276010.1 SEC-C motif-containing protein [Mycetocola sp. BIGb0189]RLP82228.1 hypothetical protein D9V34_10530 [Mycetocola lacteus]